MQVASSIPSPQSQQQRWGGLRFRLTLGLGLLSLLIGTVAVIAIWGLTAVNQSAHNALVIDSGMSRIANQVAMHALLCRRFETDYFLNINSPDEQAQALRGWNDANNLLTSAVEEYAHAATTTEERNVAKLWQAAQTRYVNTFEATRQKIEAGVITTPQEANDQLEAIQQDVAVLTDLSVQVAERKESEARQMSSSLASMSRQTIGLVSITSLVAILLAIAWTVFFPSWLMRPIAALHEGALRLATGDLSTRIDQTEDRNDEFGVLARSFNQMASLLQAQVTDLETQNSAARIARDEAEAARAAVAEQLSTIEAQRALISEMSVPILPLTNQTLVMPLVGALDTARLALSMQRALDAIQQTAARQLILDITGVPVVDTQVAQGLIQIVQAATLLGAHVILVGIRPEVAQAIVGLGINLGNIETRSTLQSGIEYSLSQTKRK